MDPALHFHFTEARVRNLVSSWFVRLWYSPLPADPAPLPLYFLSFASRLYAKGLAFRQRKALLLQRRLPAKVISVGNLVVGGTGKTPFTLWLARYLKDRGRRPAILSRGYGRRSRETCRVTPGGDTASQVVRFGDEPVLLARKAPYAGVWVGRERSISGGLAIASGNADALILDDGFQHLSLARDLDIVLLDAQNPFGNGSLLPLGPLREPAAHLERADALILTRAESSAKVEDLRSRIKKWFPQTPVFACRHRLAGFRAGLSGPRIPAGGLKGRSALAFCGIARPESFYSSLAGLGISLVRCFSFPDHHRYSRGDLAQLLRSLRGSSAQFLITTEKDMVRLPAWFQSILLAGEPRLEFDSDDAKLHHFLDLRFPSPNNSH